MDSSKIKLIIILVLSLFAALYLGIAAATAQVEAVLWVVMTAGVVVCLMLGRRIWLLLPLMTALALKLPLPGNFSTEIMAQALVIGFCFLLFLMRRLPFRPAFTELEFWGLLVIAMVAQAYMRNPVGLNLFGTGSVGGKPYALFAISIAAAFLVSGMRVQPGDLLWLVRLNVLGSLANFIIGAIGFFVPSVGYYLGASFSNDVRSETGTGKAIDEGAATRVSFVSNISGTLAIFISSRISPIRACFHPLWTPLVLISLAFAAYSGFRSQIAYVGLAYIFGIFYRGGIPNLVVSFFGGLLVLSLLAIINSNSPLPPNIQRSLTVLPGTWEQRYKDDAKRSTAWRTEMWIEALTSDRYIRNKWMGDGLGMTAEQLAQADALRDKAIKGVAFDAHRESIMISGDFHSGPVQTIKTIGYLGLLIVLLAMVRLAVHAHRQIQRCRGTEWFPVALFVGIPTLIQPIFWTFIFGDITGSTAWLMTSLAWMRMLEVNLPLPAYVTKSRSPYLLRTRQNLTGPAVANR